jgi:hypothetical protein
MNLIRTVERWSCVLKLVLNEGILLKHIHIILVLSLTIPGTSTVTERIFFVTNSVWTGGKNGFLVENTRAAVVTKMHFRQLSRM